MEPSIINKSSLRLALDSEVNALRQIALSLSSLPETEKVVFFGSRSRGDFDASSDMDILIVISDIRIKDKVISILHDIELEYDGPLSPVIFTEREYAVNKKLKSSFIENVEREGIVIYDSKRKG
ncbi:MAG: hypothetical protein OHK0032_18820 [Thermodesulfovibrionales bacterium]